MMSTARSADGATIAYYASGVGEPTLVLVHGWATDHTIWDGQVRWLDARHRVVTLDLAGHGASGAERAAWTMAAFGADVEAVVRAVGAEQVVLVGHSMAGPVVLEAARRMRGWVRGLVLVDTLLDAEQPMPPDQIEAAVKELSADYRTTVVRMADQFIFLPSTPEEIRKRVIAGALALPPASSIAMLRETWAYDARPVLRELSVPIRAVNSDRFPTNVEGNRRHMPGFEALIVPGTGHYPMLEDPARFDPELERAIAAVERGAG
jgi:pimeloyl-ACP methyl ester carboxylesterase